jgi:succinate dehydrogenase / fumarate reductase cytochrome b subunit
MTTTMTAKPALHQTAIGKKVLMAGSGLILLLWLFAHMVGNLKVWLSAKEYNGYAHWLRHMLDPPLPFSWALWIIRIISCIALVVHVYYAITLARQSRKARVTRYEHTAHIQADPAALTMRWGGLTIFLFLIFHLLNFTWGTIHPGYTYVRGNPYNNIVGNFNVWWMVVIYLVALAALTLHIYHGAWSIFQTFGSNSRRWNIAVRRFATASALIIGLGFASIPIGVITGAITK